MERVSVIRERTKAEPLFEASVHAWAEDNGWNYNTAEFGVTASNSLMNTFTCTMSLANSTISSFYCSIKIPLPTPSLAQIKVPSVKKPKLTNVKLSLKAWSRSDSLTYIYI